jgi:hypothetical protein
MIYITVKLLAELNLPLDKIEQLLHQVQQQTESIAHSCSGSDGRHVCRSGDDSPRASDLLQLFERQMRDFKMIRQDQARASSRDSATPDGKSPESLKHLDLPASHPHLKRKRCNSGGRFEWGRRILDSALFDITDEQSPAELLDAIVDKYFSQVHPWLPMLHEIRFRQTLSEQVYSANIEVILHAMVVSAVRFVRCSDTLPNHSHIPQWTKSSREWVMLNALNSLSVENLQALSIIAFDDVGAQYSEVMYELSNKSRLDKARQ